MQRPTVSKLLAPRQAQAEATVLREVLADAWTERRRHPLGSDDRAFVSMVSATWSSICAALARQRGFNPDRRG